MNLWLRMLWVLMLSLFRPRIRPLEDSTLDLRVWPPDLDLMGHVNNGRYLTFMDLGRLDLIARSGLWRIALRRRWTPVIVSAQVRFRRALKLWDRFTLHTRVLGWDERWVYIEHRLESRARTASLALVKAGFVARDGLVPVQELAAAMGVHEAPELPAAVRAWRGAEAILAEGEVSP